MADTETPGSERRVHSRIQARTTVEVRHGGGALAAELRDLSQGGASLFVAPGIEVTGTIALCIPGPDGDPVAVDVEIVRSTKLESGQQLGVRFVDTSAAELAAVDYFLGVLLSGSGGGQRAHPRIARRLNISYGSPPEFLAMVENISLGGLAMLVHEEVAVGDPLLVVLPAEDGEDLLTLPSEVVNCRPVEGSAPAEYLIGLSFQDLSTQRRALLDALLLDLVERAA